MYIILNSSNNNLEKQLFKRICWDQLPLCPIPLHMYAFYKTTLVATLVAAAAALLTVAITPEPRSTPKPGENGSIVLPVNANSILSQCGDYFTFNPETEYFGVVPEEYDKEYIPVPPMIVPVYGFMVADEFDAEALTKASHGEKSSYHTGQINRALWDGHTFIWVDPDISKEAFDYAANFAEQWNESHEKKVIVQTWGGERELPLGRQFAFSSWGISQSCSDFSSATFEEFMEQSNSHNTNRDEKTLPTATLVDGELPKKYNQETRR